MSGPGDFELPGYSSRQPPHAIPELGEQTYKLEDSKGRPWIWLSVKSRAKSDKQLPLFYERDIIQGIVEVDFDKTDGAKGVTVIVTAGVTAVGQEELSFLNITRDLWSGKSPGSSPGGSKPRSKVSWPFSIALPSDTALAERPKAPQQTYRLPPSFSERASTAYIDYKIIVTVRRGAFKVNHTLATSFVYIPIIRAEPPSRLRQLSYHDGSPILGPDADPAGWKVLSPVKICGTLFNARSVEVVCTVAISNPLSYAIGSPIPLFLTFTATDNQALDLLSTPSAVRLHLFRERIIGSHATKEDVAGRSNNTFREVVGSAFFWPAEEGAPEQGRRTLRGELEVRKGMKPTFSFPRFSLRYSISFLPFQAPGFTPSPAESVLLTEKVIICTTNTAGIVPRSYAPPGYEQAEEGNYSATVGYLENGNQRFYHHGGFQ